MTSGPKYDESRVICIPEHAQRLVSGPREFCLLTSSLVVRLAAVYAVSRWCVKTSCDDVDSGQLMHDWRINIYSLFVLIDV